MNTFSAQDLGGFPLDRESEDYTRSYKTMNDWFVFRYTSMLNYHHRIFLIMLLLLGTENGYLMILRLVMTLKQRIKWKFDMQTTPTKHLLSTDLPVIQSNSPLCIRPY